MASTVILMRIHLVKNIRHINRALLENMQNLMYSENMSEQQMSENFLRSILLNNRYQHSAKKVAELRELQNGRMDMERAYIKA